ncbi:calponin-2-like [Argonauta hians]
MALRLGPKGMDRAIQSKVLSKYDTGAEQEVRNWIKELVGEEIGSGPYEVERQLKNGITLVKLIEKVIEGTSESDLPPDAKRCTLKTNTSATPFKQMENIETFLKACKAYGVPDNSCFQTVDLFEGRNMAMVIATVLQLGTEAQRHNFNGPHCGPKPYETQKFSFDPQVLRAGEGMIGLLAGSHRFANQAGMVFGGVRHIADIRCDQYDPESQKDVGLQAGTNKFATQKGMVIGGVRHVSDIRCDQIDPESNKDINLQSGTNKFASQKGIVMGGVRHIADIRCDEYAQEAHGHIGLQSGSNKFASQKGMSFGAVRHVNDIKSDEMSEEGKRTINLQYGYTAGANQSGMTFGKNRSVVDL